MNHVKNDSNSVRNHVSRFSIKFLHVAIRKYTNLRAMSRCAFYTMAILFLTMTTSFPYFCVGFSPCFGRSDNIRSSCLRHDIKLSLHPSIRLNRHSKLFMTSDMDANDCWADLDAMEERKLYASIREHARIHLKHEELALVLGRSASVAEWARAAGYLDSMFMLTALQEGRRAQSALVKSQRRLVNALARKYSVITSSLTADDLVQEGTVGLLNAAQKFDPDRCSRFETYASICIKASILRAIANKDRLIRIPVHIHDAAGRIRAVESRLKITLNRQPTDTEIGAMIGVNSDTVASYREALSKRKITMSSSITRSNSDFSVVLDSAAAKKTILQDKKTEMSDDLKRVLDLYLDPKEIEALTLRFGLDECQQGPLTFREIGKYMHTSAEGIRRIVSRALRKLKVDGVWRILSDYADFA